MQHSRTQTIPGLPVRLTSIVGRASVIDAIGAALEECRLVTIVGPGGMGKSTVALAAAEQRQARTGGIARLLDLAHCRDGGDVLPYVVGALNLPPQRGLNARAVAEHLADQSPLLILDNCEHVIDVVAALAGEIIDRTRGVFLVATSREALRVPGERVIRLSGLPTVPPGEAAGAAEARASPAVTLLVERAAAIDARFALSDADVSAATRLCRRLDGIPLAIELAAARLDTMSVTEVVAALEDGFSMLTGGLRTATPRHRTLEATLDWSFATLSDAERLVLVSLSVFRGAFSLTQALAVATAPGQTTGHVARCVGDLVAKSLISFQPDREGRRYRMLETTRHYGRRRLAERPDAARIRRRHAVACLDQLTGARHDLQRMRRDLWIDRYGALVADVQVAIEWAFSQEGDRQLGEALVSRAVPLGEQLVLPHTYFRRLEQVADQSATADAGADPAIAALGPPLAHIRIQIHGDLRGGQAIVQRMAGLQQKASARVPEVVTAEFGAALLSGQYPAALGFAREIGTIGSARDDPALIMLAERCSAQANYYLGNFSTAAEQAQRVLDCPFEYLPHSMNNHRITMRGVLATCAAMRAEIDMALSLVEEAVSLGRKDNPLTLCVALVLAAVPVAIWAGDVQRASDWLGEARAVAARSGAAYWSLSVEQLARAVGCMRGDRDHGPAAPELEARIGTCVLDMLTTFSPALFDRHTLERVQIGLVGWNAAEVRRIHVQRTMQQAPAQALEELQDLEAMARDQGSDFWLARIEASMAALASRSGSDLSSLRARPVTPPMAAPDGRRQ